MNIKPKFQSGQIISLDDYNKHLYVEVIEEVVSRGLCWVRPLLLVEYHDDLQHYNHYFNGNLHEDTANIIDLREAGDLLWNTTAFRPALDTEVINLLSQLVPKELRFEIDKIAQKQLNLFINQIWQRHKS
ncbi:hypothetical protein H6F32_00700 [Anabaena sp. FACHB-1237]|uniref:hypothetical protein n=1 Tax=Anabaena sp. FACHB-1237 TaxID=2692769 RepID=UPI001680DC7A|nr:hypothetical protein [Anabaena sp. FACHB-1237]MBD2136131.1 hypothetical protein [Anabaena sp. FACHB-1237]